MSISVYAHIRHDTDVTVAMQEGEAGKYAVLSAGELSVFINSREKALEIANLLESSAQQREDKAMNGVKMPTLKEAMKQTGFRVCSFKFERGEQCDKCAKVQREGAMALYRRTNYWCEEGEYFCRNCVVTEAAYLLGLVEKPCRSCGDATETHCPLENPICFDCYTQVASQTGGEAWA